MRVDKINYYLDIAQAVAQRGTCLRRNYGSIIVKNDEIISTGYTGSPRGKLNCIETGKCIRNELGFKSGEGYSQCKSVHSEMNCIISASRQEMLNSTLYIVGINAEYNSLNNSTECCSICKRLLMNAGIEKVIIRRTPIEYEIQFVKDWSL